MYHYSVNGQQIGPVTEDQLRQMVASGTIDANTLVWREGMADWQPLASAIPGISSPPVQCSVCKQTYPVDQTLQISGQTVCANCKPRYVQGMREGANTTGINPGLYMIALRQRQLLICFGVLLLLNISRVVVAAAVPVVAVVLTLVALVGMIFAMICVYRLARALGAAAIIYVVGMIFPCINLLIMLVLVSRASKVLRQAGVKIGFLGVPKVELERLRAMS